MYTGSSMNLFKGSGEFFALDIGTNAIRVVQLGGAPGSWSLLHYGYAPVDTRLTTADSAESRRRLGEIIMTAVGQSGIKTKNVAIGLPSNKTFTTVIDVPTTSDAEFKAMMKYQVDQYIPMSIDDAQVDWALLGPSLHAQGQQEVLLTSTAKTYSEDRLEMVEALGFDVQAAEPDPIAMVRALVSANAGQTASLLVDMGELSTDIAITYGDTPRLIRTIPMGISSLVKAAVQNLNVKDDQARQFILKFGLAPDRLDGQVLHSIDGTLENFAAELTKSLKFFQTRYPSVQVTSIMLSGFAAVIPRLDQYLSTKAGIQAQVANPWHDVRVSQTDQQRLAAVASEFATAVGLAKRSNKS